MASVVNRLILGSAFVTGPIIIPGGPIATEGTDLLTGGGDAVLTFGGNSVVTLKGVSRAMLTNTDFVFV